MDQQKLLGLQEKSRALPQTPGVYIMKDKTGHIIYIGKAKALRRRVSQYFLRFESHVGKVRRMVENVDHFEYILTDSEFEALVLECSLIKQHRPKYNILLKDDKGYTYIRVTLEEQWPRVLAVKQKADDGSLYLGPYVSSFAVREAVDAATKAFSLPTCSRRFPQEIGKGRPCLNYFIHQCCAPCRGKMTNADYREAVDNAVEFLRGGYNLILGSLTEQMRQAAEALDFERAARLRDRIESVKKIREKQKVVAAKVPEQDVVAMASDGANMAFEVFLIRGGRLTDRESFVFDSEPDAKAARSEFLRRYYTMAKSAPRQITLDAETEDRALLEQYLESLFHRRVKIVVPQKGDQASLVAMAKSNAIEKLSQLSERPGRDSRVLTELGALLGIGRPDYIEAYDISHTAGSGAVAGMVVFEGGKPLRSAYRRFAVKTAQGGDDYASMREVVGRRLARLKEAEASGKGEGSGFGRRPDLILLDGGHGQVSAVQPLLAEYGFDIPLFGMVKDDRHRTRAIAADGGEIAINQTRNVFTLVSEIQEEVHRFAIAYHRKTRTKREIASRLEEVPGIGPKRAKALMKQFKTMDHLAAASPEALEEVPGMTAKAAAALLSFLRGEEGEQVDNEAQKLDNMK